ncbi:MAG: transposase [Pirellulales bacterium]|nr:transposase [Pirellulales bacterium]
MVRPLRLEFPGAVYHVMSRGNERQPIVRDAIDYQKRIDWLRRTVEMYGWQLFAFVIMRNHDHLFLKTPEPNLSQGMHLFNGSYTGYFNRRHRRCGHLFQGRYRGHIIDEEGYYLEVSRYIHLNPVRARLVQRPEDYPYSSYRSYCGKERQWPWVASASVLQEFDRDSAAARRAYRRFVYAGIAEKKSSPFVEAEGGLILGSSKFIDRIRKLLGKLPSNREVPALRQLRPRPSLPQIVKLVADHFDCDSSAWRPGARINDSARAAAAYLARHTFGYPATSVAQAVGYTHHSSVTRAVARIENASAEVQKKLSKLEEMLR